MHYLCLFWGSQITFDLRQNAVGHLGPLIQHFDVFLAGIHYATVSVEPTEHLWQNALHSATDHFHRHGQIAGDVSPLYYCPTTTRNPVDIGWAYEGASNLVKSWSDGMRGPPRWHPIL